MFLIFPAEFLLIILAAASAKSIHKGRRYGINGGQPAKITEFPHQVFIKYLKYGDFDCGGSLIHFQNVLTSASCVIEQYPEQLLVIAGTDDVYSSGEEYTVIEIFRHPNYLVVLEQGESFDIAILKLETAVKTSDRVWPIPFAGPGFQIRDGKVLIASGIGSDGDSSEPHKLKKVAITKLDWSKCDGIYHSASGANVFCAGGNGQGASIGDSGGPLIQKTSKGSLLVGVTCYCSNCAETNNADPTLFVGVAKLYVWINETISRWSYDKIKPR